MLIKNTVLKVTIEVTMRFPCDGMTGYTHKHYNPSDLQTGLNQSPPLNSVSYYILASVSEIRKITVKLFL